MRSHLLRFFLGWLSVGALALVMEKERTAALPWLYLLAYPAAVQQIGAPLPGIPIRRPQREEITTTTTTSRPMQDAIEATDNSVIREQFLQGLLQGLQQSPGPTIHPAVLADFLSQATTITTSTTEKPIIEKDANGQDSGNDDDYEYIDFKNGSRIKYDLDEGESHKQLTPTTRPPQVERPQPNPVYIYYRPYYYY